LELGLQVHGLEAHAGGVAAAGNRRSRRLKANAALMAASAIPHATNSGL